MKIYKYMNWYDESTQVQTQFHNFIYQFSNRSYQLHWNHKPRSLYRQTNVA